MFLEIFKPDIGVLLFLLAFFCIIAKQKSNKLQNIQQIPQNKVLKTVFRFVNFFSIKVEYEGCVLRSFQLFLMKWYSIIPSFSHTLSDTVVRNVFCFILALNYQFLPSSWFLGSAFGNIFVHPGYIFAFPRGVCINHKSFMVKLFLTFPDYDSINALWSFHKLRNTTVITVINTFMKIFCCFYQLYRLVNATYWCNW